MAFWHQIARGLLPEEAAGLAGVAQASPARWFHKAGGMPPFDINLQPSARYLSFAEREEIALLKAQNQGVTDIARAIGRDPGTISGELRRNAAIRSGKVEYRASVAQWKADKAARRPMAAKLATNLRLREVRPAAAGRADQPSRRHGDRRPPLPFHH